VFARDQRPERCRRAARIASFVMLSAIPVFPVGAASRIDPPTGVYLWYPQKGTAPSDSDCRDLVRNTRPSVEKAEDWLWGRVPNNPDSEPEFYLFVRQHDMETTYSAEGDYDTGSVTWTATDNGRAQFELRPSDHPDTVILGYINVPMDSSVVTVVLKDVPSATGKSDRTTFFCRFDQGVDI
jgi:hypothetical protein